MYGNQRVACSGSEVNMQRYTRFCRTSIIDRVVPIYVFCLPTHAALHQEEVHNPSDVRGKEGAVL